MTVMRLHMTETAESDIWRLIGRHDGRPVRQPDLEPDLEGLAEDLNRVLRAWRFDDSTDLLAAVTDISHRSSRLGLNRLCRVARTVATLVGSGDRPALAANVARLDRLGQATLSDICRLQDMPG